MKQVWQAPGKVILIGEYAVLAGADALVAGINRFARITITRSQDNYSKFMAGNLSDASFTFKAERTGLTLVGAKTKSAQFALQTIKNCITYLQGHNREFASCHINADTSQFYDPDSGQKLGLGSSAAISVTLMQALLAYHDIRLKSADLLDMMHEIHHESQGKKGSGIDIAVSIFGGILRYNIGPDARRIKQIQLPIDLFLTFVWTGIAASTSDMLIKLDLFKSHKPESYAELMQNLKVVANDACASFEQADTGAFLNQTGLYNQHLKELGDAAEIPIISRAHQKVADLVSEYDARYKPSGAGGGDFGIVFTRSLEQKQQIEQEIRRRKIKIVDLDISPLGVHQLKGN